MVNFSCYSPIVFRFAELKEEHERLITEQNQSAEMDVGATENLPTLEDEGSIQETPRGVSEGLQPAHGESKQAEKEEQGRSADEMTHKNRSKRESRRMRELEQAQFSLDLLKVRTTSVGGVLHDASAPESNILELENQQRQSPQASPTSHRRLELLGGEDMESESQVMAAQEYPHPLQEGLRDSNYNEKPPSHMDGPRATFYIASDQSPVHQQKFESPSKAYKDRTESTSRRPVVVLISMQKESPVEEQGLLAAHTHQGDLESQAASFDSNMTPIMGLEVTSDIKEPPGPDSHLEPSAHRSSPELPGVCSSEVDIQITLEPKDVVPSGVPSGPPQEAPSPILDTKPPKAQKKSSAQTVIVNMVEKPTNTVFSPPRRKLPFSK